MNSEMMNSHRFVMSAPGRSGRRGLRMAVSGVSPSIMFVASVLAASYESNADVQIFEAFGDWQEGRIAWEAQVGEWSTLDFTGLPAGEFFPEDYYLDDFGVMFGGGPRLASESEEVYLQDGHGVGVLPDSSGWHMDVFFDTPVHAFAVDFPGEIRFTLFFEGEVIAHLPGPYGGFVGWFAGLISDQPFDRVRVWDTDAFLVDDLRFGMVVPGPATALVLLPGLGLLGGRRRSG